MASCCSVVSRPRISAGETSAIYAGATTEAAPTPNPPISRKTKKTSAEREAPAPAAPTAKSTAVSSISGLRPILSAYCPASKAPIADPTNTDATENPVPTPDDPNSLLNAATVPLITEASKPKRNPASVATMHTNTRYASGLSVVCERIGSRVSLHSPHEGRPAAYQQCRARDVRAV